MNTVRYNCSALPKAARKICQKPTLCSILYNNDNYIIFLQETWFSKQDLDVLNGLHPEFYGARAAKIDYRVNPFKGHLPGGVAVLWRSNLDKFITPLQFDNLNWIIGIVVNCENKSYVILCVYMLCLNNTLEHDNQYLESLGVLNSKIDDLNITCTSIFGDWNANISKDSNTCTFGNYLQQFCEDNYV